ncbi:MAG TPA: hypothetical protein VG325_05675 [Solirubrobacteraceae bacterium]|nr:hypothetical protein [Solirubrobacteraceae bacterium]
MSRPWVRPFTILCCIGALAMAGCASGSSSSSSAAGPAAASATSTGSATSSTELPTVKFVLHAGLAVGAFHHWIYTPIKAGVLKHPFSHKLTLVKAGLAALFVYHELKIAVQDAKASKVLRPVVAPLEAAANKLDQLKASITGGSVNPADLTGINSQLSQAAHTAKSAGQSITESVPSLAQITAGGS